MKREVIVSAPATVANWGPGYDLLGAAVAGVGDTVTIRTLPDEPGVMRIASITGDGGKLPLQAEDNTAGIAAIEARKLAGQEELGMELVLEKGLPLGSGLGSSAARTAGRQPRRAALPRLFAGSCSKPPQGPPHANWRIPAPPARRSRIPLLSVAYLARTFPTRSE